ncbi:MAG: hypothetical protein FJX97_00680 [Bacteroidetes bacterium]|nr:hypothetical protein [Bacteroidota bacterium]
MPTEKRNCHCCGQVLYGRSDKKFCDDGCRNTFNNQQNSIQNKEMRSINTVLKRNRAILLAKLPEGKKHVKVSKEQLLVMGFNFTYLTHRLVLPRGLTAQFCYELGWVNLDEKSCLIIRG